MLTKNWYNCIRNSLAVEYDYTIQSTGLQYCLQLHCITSQAGDAVVKWLYTDAVDLHRCSDDFIIQLMKTANKYMLHGLQLRYKVLKCEMKKVLVDDKW